MRLYKVYHFGFGIHLAISIILMAPLSTKAQDLADYQWQNRLVLILTEDSSNPDFQEQVRAFQAAEEDLQDLRIVVFQALPQRYIRGTQQLPNWISGDQLYESYKSRGSSFEFLLLGLDGDIKLRRHRVVTLDELYELINTMPMRRAELRRRGGG